MRVSLAKELTYIPKWNGNRKLKKEEQVVVTYRYMTSQEEEELSVITPKYKIGDKSGESEIEIKPKSIEVWDKCVIRVSGLVDEKDTPITEPAKVRAIPGIYELVTEVVAEIRKGFTGEEEKN